MITVKQFVIFRDFYSTASGQKRKSDTFHSEDDSQTEETDTVTPKKQPKKEKQKQTANDKKIKEKEEEEKREKVKSPPSTKRQTKKRSSVESDASKPTLTKTVEKKSKQHHKSDAIKSDHQNKALSDSDSDDNQSAAAQFETSTHDNDVAITPTENVTTVNSPTTECPSNTSIEKPSKIDKRRLSAQAARISKFAVDDYIPLGVAHRYPDIC